MISLRAATFQINLVTRNTGLAARVSMGLKYTDQLQVISSPDPIKRVSIDAYIVPESIFLSPETMEDLSGRAVVVGYGAPGLLDAAFCSGCSDYLKDPWVPTELFTRLVRLRTSMNLCMDSTTLTLRGLRLVTDTSSIRLTGHESLILRILLKNQGSIVSRETLGKIFLHQGTGTNSRALDMHISSLRKKLRLITRGKPDSMPIVTIRGLGYMVEATSPVDIYVDNSVHNSMTPG